LKRQGVFEVGYVERNFSLHVVDQSTEQSVGSLQAGLLSQLLLVRFLVEVLLGLLLLRSLPDFLRTPDRDVKTNEDVNESNLPMQFKRNLSYTLESSDLYTQFSALV